MKCFGPITEVLIVTILLCLKFLFLGNMGDSNEVDVLPLAKQYVDPTWLPGDWYLNQPPGYRWLFHLIVGTLITHWGFLVTSLLGRSLCYGLFSVGLVRLRSVIGLSFPGLILSVILLFYLIDQNAIADEWMVGGLEAKSIAYGFVMLAIGLLLDGTNYGVYLGSFLCLGLATSFHVLVGGWSFLIASGWLVWRRWKQFPHGWQLGLLGLIYFVGSGFAIPAVLEQILTPSPPSATLSSSFIYVFLRLPHHLNPLSWKEEDWIGLGLHLLLFGISILWFKVVSVPVQEAKPQDCLSFYWHPNSHFYLHPRTAVSPLSMAELAALALVAFGLGVAIAPWDHQGQLLQYYPFRLGDILLPLSTALILSAALEQTLHRQKRHKWMVTGTLIIAISVCMVQIPIATAQIQSLTHFPGEQQDVSKEWKDMCHWVQTQTPPNAVVITAPTEHPSFSWLAERSIVANYKLLPQNKTAIWNWYERMSDLSGGKWPNSTSRFQQKSQIKQQLSQGYQNLSAIEIKALMTKYQASYFITSRKDLSLPIAYENNSYSLYSNPSSVLLKTDAK